MTDSEDELSVRRVRMPIEDRIPPQEWVSEQQSGPSPTQAAAAEAEAQERRKETEWGFGAFGG